MRILPRREVSEKTRLQKSAIYQRMAAGTFPKPVRLGPKAIGWVEYEIDAWIQARIDERDGKVGVA